MKRSRNRRRRLERGHALVVAVWLAVGCSCSARSSAGDGDEALDRLRERIEEQQTAQAAEQTAQQEEETQRSEPSAQPDRSLLLEPRYAGSLPDDDTRVLGVFRLRTHPDPIIDGDTVAVVGLDATLRLVGLDTEETFHGNAELRLRASADFDHYVRTIYEESEEDMPKFGTPMGELASEFAHEFFAGQAEVRLEYDDLRRTRGYFDRYLVYVFALQQGRWLNYNLEAVRAGMSPYFNKYGHSTRFHDEFVEAQNEAREAGRGIWDPALQHYPDYEARLVWWTRRAEAIRHYHENYSEIPSYVEVGVAQDWYRLPELEGQTITVFGTLADFHYDWNPPRVMLAHRRADDFALIGFTQHVFDEYQLERYRGEYVYVRGRLAFYQGRPQFVVDDGAIEVWTEP